MPFTPLTPQKIIAAVRRLLADSKLQPLPQHAINQTAAMALGDAPITISLAQLDELRTQLRTAREQSVQLELQLTQARATDPAGRVEGLRVLIREMLTIVRYAVANLPPSENPKWPWGAVRRMAVYLAYLPDFNADDRVLVTELELFVADIQEHDIARARKRDELIAFTP